MAKVVATLGSGVTLGLGVGSGEPLGWTAGVAVGASLVSGEAVGSSVGSTVGPGVSVGATDGWLDAVGGGLGLGPVVGRAITTTVSLPVASVPTTTAWLRTGDWEMDFGRIVITTRFASLPETRAQSGWFSSGQTSSTSVTL
jgi:hypothetical protein